VHTITLKVAMGSHCQSVAKIRLWLWDNVWNGLHGNPEDVFMRRQIFHGLQLCA